MGDAIKNIFGNLASILRHALPGLIIVSMARVSRPLWFVGVVWTEKWHLVMLAVIAIVVGNVWYAFHRYLLHQLLDFLFYLMTLQGPARETTFLKGTRSYSSDLAKHVVKSYGITPELRSGIVLRTSYVQLMSITTEACVFFALWPGALTFFARHRPALLCIGIVAFVLTQLQNILTRRIDSEAVNEPVNTQAPKPSA